VRAKKHKAKEDSNDEGEVQKGRGGKEKVVKPSKGKKAR